MLGEGEYNWFLFEQVESSINEISDYVSVQNQEVASRRVALKLFEAGTLVEGMMKKMVNDREMDKFPGLKDDLEKARRTEWPFPDIRSYAKVLESCFALSKRIVNFRLFNYSRQIKPFETFSRAEVAPDWWDAYNSVKHDFGNLERAKLGKLVDATAALFLLTVLYHVDWPQLVYNSKMMCGSFDKKSGAFISQPVDEGGFIRALYVIFMPWTQRQGETSAQEIFANSRLYFSHLAHSDNPLSGSFQIPPND